jgi:GPH family glycoside/pentoside/hexuronide:cation symporter
MPFFQTLKVLASYRNWTLNVLFEMLYSLNIGFVTSNLLYFTRYVLGNSAAITPLMIAYIVGNVAMLPFIGLINRRLGRKRTMVLGSALLVLSKLVAMINLESFVVVVIHSVIMGAAVSLCIVIFFSNRGDIVDVIAHRSGERMESIVLSFSSMLRKMTASLGALIMGLILQYSGYNAELAVQLDSAVFGIKTLICYLPLGFSILMLFVSLAMTLDRDVAEIRTAL